MTSMTATLVTSAPRSLPTAEDLRRAWRDSPRWQGVRRAYDAGDAVPAVVRRINNTLRRADEIHHAEGDDSVDWLKPIVADAEAGFGGVLNAFELMKQMIDAGAAGVHFEDQLASAKKCGHMGGKV